MKRDLDLVMLVDDEDDHHFITRLTLRKAGFTGRFESFHDAHQALAHLRSMPVAPDLFLVDINMPGVSGFQLLETCEREGLLPNDRTLVVMCSSSNRPVDIEAARGFRSVNDYIEKSFSVEQFQRLRDAFQRGHRRTFDPSLPS